MALIETAPALQDVVLRLYWKDLDITSLDRFDWSILELQSCIRPRIHLAICHEIQRIPVPSMTILGALEGNKALMDLVKRGAVILKPKHHPEALFEEWTDF